MITQLDATTNNDQKADKVDSSPTFGATSINRWGSTEPSEGGCETALFLAGLPEEMPEELNEFQNSARLRHNLTEHACNTLTV